MTLQYADRVQETFTTTGTGTLSLAGAVVGYQAFSAICSSGDTCYYAATDGTNWEVGLGTYTTSGDTLARTTILSSSNSGNAVNWAAGTKNIWLTLPAGQVSQSFLGLRNRILNGDMRIDQRNAGASQTLTTSVAYTVDRFYAGTNGANATGQQVAGSGADQYAYKLTGAASVTALIFGQRIEATNIYDLAGQVATFSVNLANTALTTVSWTAYYANSVDNWGAKTSFASGTFSVNSTKTRYTAQMTLPANAVNGVDIELTVGAQVSGTWTISDFQLEGGVIATPFERRPVSYELAQCQRYYETSYNAGTAPGSSFPVSIASQQGSGASGLNMFNNVCFKTTKRATPSVITYDASGASNKISYYNGSWQNGGTATALTAYTTGFSLQLQNTGSIPYDSFEWAASAEL